MNRVAAAFIVGTLTTAAAADEDGVELADFAYAMPIDTGAGAAPFYAVSLPEAVYRTLTRPDHGDIRVFDANGRVIPHMFRPSPAPAPGATSSRLPLFALPPGATSASPGRDVHVRVDEQGAVIDVIGAEPAQSDSLYLVDASAVTAPIEALQLDWGARQDRLLARVRVECSEDLDRWREVATGSIAELQEADTHLYQNVITLPKVHCRYLRLAWPLSEVRLARIDARLVAPEADRAPVEPMQWRVLEHAGIVDGNFEFDAGGLFPVTRINVTWPADRTVAKLRVEARAEEAAEWNAVHTGLYFALDVDGRPLSNESVPIQLTVARHWRIGSAQGGDPAMPAAPRLEIGWHPDRLVFVAAGTPPYQLAYGNAAASPGSTLAASLFDRLHDPDRGEEIGQAVLGVARTVAGDAALVPPAPPLPWQRILLWIVLATGVLLLGRMAISLYREMTRHGQ
jgi:hypothetical protein